MAAGLVNRANRSHEGCARRLGCRPSQTGGSFDVADGALRSQRAVGAGAELPAVGVSDAILLLLRASSVPGG